MRKVLLWQEVKLYAVVMRKPSGSSPYSNGVHHKVNDNAPVSLVFYTASLKLGQPVDNLAPLNFTDIFFFFGQKPEKDFSFLSPTLQAGS